MMMQDSGFLRPEQAGPLAGRWHRRDVPSISQYSTLVRKVGERIGGRRSILHYPHEDCRLDTTASNSVFDSLLETGLRRPNNKSAVWRLAS